MAWADPQQALKPALCLAWKCGSTCRIIAALAQLEGRLAALEQGNLKRRLATLEAQLYALVSGVAISSSRRRRSTPMAGRSSAAGYVTQ